MDNFCWCSSLEQERLGQLKQAVQACFDFAVAFETPFISGKDSMFNDFKGFDENNNPVKISVPPTLLISSIGTMDSAAKAVSMDLKSSGDLIYVLGETKNELGASEFFASKGFIGNNVPKVDAEKAIVLYQALSRAIEAGLVASAQPVSFGGLGIAIAKTCLAGDLGAKIDLKKVPRSADLQRNDFLLFSESQSRFVVSIAKKDKQSFEKIMQGNSFAQIGTVGAKAILIKGLNGKTIAKIKLQDANEAYRKTLRGY
jgi:phosphoribosylformylglycinamidine synthase